MDTTSRPNRRLLRLITPILLVIVLSACGDAENNDQASTDTLSTDPTAAAADTARTIQDVLQEESRFSQFATAVDSAGLAQTLSGPGPFTVFAPSNEAFSGQQDVNQLLSSEQRDRLRGLLLYHISSGERMADDLQDGTTLRTLEGSDLVVTGSGDSLRVGTARIVEEDVRTANGIIHVIDQVLAPAASADGV